MNSHQDCDGACNLYRNVVRTWPAIRSLEQPAFTGPVNVLPSTLRVTRATLKVVRTWGRRFRLPLEFLHFPPGLF